MANTPRTSGVFSLGALGGDGAGVAGDANWNDVVQLFDGASNGSTLTSAAGANNGTLTYNATATGDADDGGAITAQPNGTSLVKYDTTGGYVTATADPDFAFGTGAFTVETWVYVTQNPTSAYGDAVFDTRKTANGAGILLVVTPSLKLDFYSAGWRSSVSSSTLTLNTWHHIALSRDGNNNWTTFVDGTAHSASTFSTTLSDNNCYWGAVFDDGGSGLNTNWRFTGYMSDMRVTKGVARDIAADWTAGVYTSALPQGAPVAAATRPTRRWGGMTGRSLVASTAGTPAFKAVTYTGSNSAQDVTVGFQPDFAWIKCRNDNISHSVWDSVRGADKLLAADTTATETTLTNTVVTDADGMTLYGGYSRINSSTNGRTYVAWCLKAGGAGVSNTTGGSITSTVSANVEAGFSIIGYEGNGTSGATVPHGLDQAPEFVIAKQLDQETNNWDCFHVGLDATNPAHKHIYLNSPNGVTDNINRWNDTLPSSSVVTLGNGFTVNRPTRDYIMYCFHSVPGFSKIGSYSGSGSSGNKVTTGFKPAFVMIKSTGSGNWVMIDDARSPINPADELLYANSSGQEPTPSTATSINFLDDGFDFGGGGSSINGTSTTYIYLAFAEEIPGADTFPTTGVLSLAEHYQSKL